MLILLRIISLQIILMLDKEIKILSPACDTDEIPKVVAPIIFRTLPSYAISRTSSEETERVRNKTFQCKIIFYLVPGVFLKIHITSLSLKSSMVFEKDFYVQIAPGLSFHWCSKK